MWAKSGEVVFVARVVFPGETGRDQPTNCSDIELSRLLVHRLEVLAAALRQLGRIEAMQRKHQEKLEVRSYAGSNNHFSQ